jgi:peptidoglycan/xylan/chitin deacetylase (PgdA/CDA1 family)
MDNPGYLTISIDDGHPTDLRSAELLARYSLKATFYIPARNPERDVMTESQVKEIARTFEVGSHTFNHRPLKCAPREEARTEIENGKKWLEDVTGKEAVAFCYPQGKFNPVTVKLVRQAGFLGGRTCMFNLNGIPENPFVWGVSTHAYSHSIVTQIRHALLEQNFLGLLNFATIHKFAQDWAEHFSHALDFVERYGGVAHLYFHSWEIEEKDHWNKLENLLNNISRRKTFIRVTNGDLFAQWQPNRHDTVTNRL